MGGRTGEPKDPGGPSKVDEGRREPPPFAPDYELITYLEGGSEREIRRLRERLRREDAESEAEERTAPTR
ncbi:MAG: hypothetical protein ACXWWX_04915 [Actinomycetota bacterium]